MDMKTEVEYSHGYNYKKTNYRIKYLYGFALQNQLNTMEKMDQCMSKNFDSLQAWNIGGVSFSYC